MVLIVDENSARATATARLVRMLGSIPVIASREPVAARLLPDVDVVLAAASPLAPKVLGAARAFRRVLRCLVGFASEHDFEPQRGFADVVVRAPFTAVALGDVLSKGAARRQAWLAEQAALRAREHHSSA